jgi:hypothetical protein
MALRWDRCVDHRQEEARDFVAEYFEEAKRQVLLLTGAGFDPRSLQACNAVSSVAGDRLRGVFIREERPNPSQELVDRAISNLQGMIHTVPSHEILKVEIFSPDGAVIGGRRITSAVAGFDLTRTTDVVVDFSSLSIGVTFPVVRHLLERAEKEHSSFNLHLMTVHNPALDEAIEVVASDAVGTIHGFRGGLGLQETVEAARLWLPQLVRGQRAILNRIYRSIEPHDVCPILPFPATNPRMPDDLIEHYLDEFANIWEVDAHDIVYADENSALDLYRTTVKIDDARRRVFEAIGGSLLILSPLGSKLLAIGALMAAVERDFPVVYVEPIGYAIDPPRFDEQSAREGNLVHIWLHGEVYGSFGGRVDRVP